MNSITLAPPAKNRITRELAMLSSDPPPGISCYAPTDNLTYLHGTIVGPPDTPFESAIFLLTINIPNRYPFEPPRVRFVTPLWHPNIDASGRICLDTLKSRPAGSWSPAVSLPSLLLSIRSLMAEPNSADGLVANVTKQFKENNDAWYAQASQQAKYHATDEKLVEHEERLIALQQQQQQQQQSITLGGQVKNNVRIIGRKKSKLFSSQKGKENQEKSGNNNYVAEDCIDDSSKVIGKRKRETVEINNENEVVNSTKDFQAKRM